MKKSEIMKLSDYKIDKLIKITGTKFDRRNKLSETQINNIKNEFAKGVKMAHLADKYNVSQYLIKYHLDPDFKTKVNIDRVNKYTFKHYSSREQLHDRAEYKRSLVDSYKIKLSSIGA